MEDKVKEVVKIISDGKSREEFPIPSPLTQYAIDIATFAFTAFKGDLREKALNIAKAIVEYEDEIEKQ